MSKTQVAEEKKAKSKTSTDSCIQYTYIPYIPSTNNHNQRVDQQRQHEPHQIMY